MKVFQAKHYKAIAKIIASLPYHDYRQMALDIFCAALVKDNPKFKEEKFRDAVWRELGHDN